MQITGQIAVRSVEVRLNPDRVRVKGKMRLESAMVPEDNDIQFTFPAEGQEIPAEGLERDLFDAVQAAANALVAEQV